MRLHRLLFFAAIFWFWDACYFLPLANGTIEGVVTRVLSNKVLLKFYNERMIEILQMNVLILVSGLYKFLYQPWVIEKRLNLPCESSFCFTSLPGSDVLLVNITQCFFRFLYRLLLQKLPFTSSALT
jgi:hypothetical protein